MVILFLILSFINDWLIYFNPPAPRPEGSALPTFEAAKIAETLLPYLATPLGVALGYYFTKERARG